MASTEIKTNNILDFFTAAAVRKGARDLPKWLKHRETAHQIVQDKRDYRIEFYFDNKSQHASQFTVFSDGRWTLDAGKMQLDGKLQPPHAKSWVEKMINKGVPGELARLDWEKYRKLRNGKI